MKHHSEKPQGVGLGLRKEIQIALKEKQKNSPDFIEVAPENWIGMGGAKKNTLREMVDLYPLVCHGLSLSLGGLAPLDENLLLDIKEFLSEYDVQIYSEHLSYCSDTGHLYNLFPIPFTEEAVHYVSNRIKRAQEILERKIAVENISYYYAPGQELSEVDFINAVLDEANCDLLLDVNNIHVNSVNHSYDAKDFLKKLNPKSVSYIHIAGHDDEDPTVLIDTHGEPIIEPVWELLEQAYERFGPLPTLLERDFNLPPLSELLIDVERIRKTQRNSKQIQNKPTQLKELENDQVVDHV